MNTNKTSQQIQKVQEIEDKILKDCETIREYINKNHENTELAQEPNLDADFENLKSNLKKLENISQKMTEKYIELYTQKCTHVSFLLCFFDECLFKV